MVSVTNGSVKTENHSFVTGDRTCWKFTQGIMGRNKVKGWLIFKKKKSLLKVINNSFHHQLLSLLFPYMELREQWASGAVAPPLKVTSQL